MKKTLTPRDVALIAAAAYPHHDSSFLNVDFERPDAGATPESVGDGLAHFVISECAGYTENVNTFVALNESLRLMSRAHQEVQATMFNLDRYLGKAIAACYLEYLIEHQKAHTVAGLAAWLDLSFDVNLNFSRYYNDVQRHLKSEIGPLAYDEIVYKNVLAKLRKGLSIDPTELPAGVHHEPLWDADTNAKPIEIAAADVRHGESNPKGDAVAK